MQIVQPYLASHSYRHSLAARDKKDLGALQRGIKLRRSYAIISMNVVDRAI